MANTIHLISKEYLNPNIVSSIVEKVAARLNYNFGKDYSQAYDIIEINIFIENISEYISIYINCKPDHFNDTYNNLYGISGFGIMIDIDCYYENPLLIPFLREMLKEIPELLVYNEEALRGSGAYVYTKSHLDNFSGVDSYALLTNPPQDLSSMV